jgi:hypothetical protein
MRKGSTISRVGRVPERPANLADAEVQPLFEVHEGVAAPDVLPDLGARHDVAGAAHEQFQHLEGLRRQLDQVALVTELAPRRIEIERAETDGG